MIVGRREGHHKLCVSTNSCRGSSSDVFIDLTTNTDY